MEIPDPSFTGRLTVIPVCTTSLYGSWLSRLVADLSHAHTLKAHIVDPRLQIILESPNFIIRKR